MKPSGSTNLEIAELLRDVAASYQLKDAKKNFFKIAAYQRAADAVEHSTSELKDLWDEGKLSEVPGIGEGIASHLDELFRTGQSKHFGNVMKGLPAFMFNLMKVPGIGPKTAYKMVKEGNIPKEVTEELKKIENRPKRYLLPYASVIALEIIDWMKQDKNTLRADSLGSLRRQTATVGDIDISIASKNPKASIEHFVRYPKTQKILEKGEHSASIVVSGQIQIDSIAQRFESYGSLLQHLTGSKHHNVALREYARSLSPSLSLSEYGIKNLRTKKLKKIKTEEEFYKTLRLDYIEPELRENSGEIKAALKSSKAFQGKHDGLPHLVELKDIKADLQIHSDFDIETSHDLGQSSMEEIIEKADEMGYEYIAFTEHNPSKSGHKDSQVVEILKRKREKIDQLNYSLQNKNTKFTRKVFNSLEIDISIDGELSIPTSGLETLDFALVSIHGSFRLSKNEMTKRVLSALAYPKVKIFAHPTARKIGAREGIDLDWPKIFGFCVKNNKFLEINADPMRLDLPDNLVKDAIKQGVKLTLGTDAHHKNGLNNMVWGVSVARRGWAEKSDIINTRSLEEFKEVIKK